MTPARDPNEVELLPLGLLLRLGVKRRRQDQVAKIGQPAFGNQHLAARIY